MPTLGTSELLIILVIIILVFGLGRLPQVGRGLGQMIRVFRQNVSEDESAAPEAVTPPTEPAVETQAPDGQAEGEVSPPEARGLGLKEALQEVVGLFQGAKWKAVEERLATIEAERQDEHRALLTEIGELKALVIQMSARLEQVEETVTPEELTRWQTALKKLRGAIVVVLGVTAGAAYEPVVQDWLVPETMKKLEQLRDRLEPVLEGLEPVLPQFEVGQAAAKGPGGQAPLTEAEPTAQVAEAKPERETTVEQPATEPQSESKSRRLRGRHPREPETIVIPAGEFLMGSDRRTLERAGVWQDWMEREMPSHRVYLPAYAIGRCPVTNAEYARFVEAGGYRRREFWTRTGWQTKEEDKWTQPRYWTDERWNQASYPVVGVSWYECVAYCRWLSQVSGRLYRLPSEAEWEKAARGPEGRIWPWGNRWDPKRCNSHEGGAGRTTPVGHYSPEGDSYYDVADMVGNVWEWCATKVGGEWSDPEFKPYPYNTQEDEWDSNYLEGISLRVLRGGSWGDVQYDARCAARDRYDPSDRNDFGGYRVVSPI